MRSASPRRAATGSRSRARPSRASPPLPARACSPRSAPGSRPCPRGPSPSAPRPRGSSPGRARPGSPSPRGGGAARGRITEREGPRTDAGEQGSEGIAAARTGGRGERRAGGTELPGSGSVAGSLDPVAPAALAQVLGREHPQVVALVLANLRARKAAQVLAALPEDLQPEIAERIADLQSVPEDLLTDVGDVLAGQVQGLGRAAPRAAFLGAKLVADILNVADEALEARVFAHLEAHAPEVAEAIRGLMLTFEDLLRLDDRGMQALLKEIVRDDLMRALKTASPAMREKILGNLPQRTAEILQEDVGVMGPVRLKDVEQAQARIVAAARRLDAELRITLGAHEGDVVV